MHDLDETVTEGSHELAGSKIESKKPQENPTSTSTIHSLSILNHQLQAKMQQLEDLQLSRVRDAADLQQINYLSTQKMKLEEENVLDH